MDNLLIYIPVILYLLILVYIAIKVVVNNESVTTDQFLKGSSNYTWKILTITLVATFIGPGFSLGTIDSTVVMGWTFGLAVACTPIHMLITGYFLKRSKNAEAITNFRTAGGLVEQTFGPISRPLLGISVVILYTIFAAQLIAGSVVILDVVYGFSGETIAILIALIVASYSLSCGISGVVKTDILQFIFLGILLSFFVYVGVNIVSTDIPTSATLSESVNIDFNFSVFLGIAVIFLLGDAFQPVYLTRAFFGKNSKSAGNAFILGGSFAIIWFIILTLVGLAIANQSINFNSEQGVIVETLGFILPRDGASYALIVGLIGAGFVGLIMSTLDSVLNSASGSLIDDFVSYFYKNISESNKLVLMKVSVAVLAIIGSIVASYHPNMITLLLQAYDIWIPTMLGLLIISFFRVGRPTKIPSFVPLLAFFIGVFVWSFGFIFDDYLLPWSVYGFIVNILVLLIAINHYKTDN